MSSNPDEVSDEEIAEAFGREIDPLAEHSETFENLPIDTFEEFIEDVLESKDRAKSTIDSYQRAFDQWAEWMERQDRHPACPNESHVHGWIAWRRDEHGNGNRTIKFRLQKLIRWYEYLVTESKYPHEPGFEPFRSAKKKTNLDTETPEKPRRMTVEDLQQAVSNIKHIRDRAIVVLQLKTGMRASEVCNVEISDVHIDNAELRKHYPDMGTAEALDGRRNAIYIPSRHERPPENEGNRGNKSKRPRVLPLDDEARRVLQQYLLIRPENPEGVLFLSKQNHNKLRRADVNRPWKEAFAEWNDDDDEYRDITSHYGRHRFSTWWEKEKELQRELVKYMRGDTTGEGKFGTEAIDSYIHTYYEDIEPVYLQNIYKLGV